jgi:transcriptional regulator with XRE-family HTH domain
MYSMNNLSAYIRRRAKALDLTLTEVCKRAKISRQTLYSLQSDVDRLPALETIIVIAQVLKIHPLQLLNLFFETRHDPMAPKLSQAIKGDKTSFVQDVSYPDGDIVAPKEWLIKTWELKNTGTVPWKNRQLICIDDEIAVFTRLGESLKIGESLTPQSSKVAIPDALPGDTVRVSVKLLTPSQPGTVFSYWKAVFHDGSYCFPTLPGVWCKVRVMANKVI